MKRSTKKPGTFTSLIHKPNGACFNFRLSLEVPQLYHRLQCGQVALCARFQDETRFVVPHLYVRLEMNLSQVLRQFADVIKLTELLLLSSFIDDFMLLLCASFQRQVFDDENKAAVRLMAGDNVEICRDLDAASFSVHNPVPDFIHCRYG